MKTVLITGATSGLGYALTAHYAKHGYHVIACGRDTKKLAPLVSLHSNIEPLAFDITNKQEVKQTAKMFDKPLELIIFNAGDCQYIDNVASFDSDKFADVVQVNLIALAYMLEHFLVKVPKGGQIAFVSSIVTANAFPKSHAYGASKAGVDYLARTLRFDLKDSDINVCLIHPGFIQTPLTDKNTFDMPFIMTSENAAKRIFNGLKKRKTYLCFPKRFNYLLKLFRILPDFLWQKAMFRTS